MMFKIGWPALSQWPFLRDRPCAVFTLLEWVWQGGSSSISVILDWMGCVGMSKKHHQGFKEAMVGAESSLPLISFPHLNIIETPSDIQLSEILCPTELLD
jgi:hypothetical protein